MKLASYRKKRNPGVTNEPFGGEPSDSAAPTTRGAYVVHLHHATRLHYDLRLEMGGVLASFAVPKGPSFDPDEKRFAAHTEDHPLEYLDFEDVIPKGQYGAGPMIVWDRGSVQFLDGTAEDGVARGKLDFVLGGYKLRGRFALVRLKTGEGKDWLLLKKKDAFSTKERDVVIDQPRSVLSGLLVDELPDAKALGARLEAKARAAGAPAREVDGPGISPMVAREHAAAEGDGEQVHELLLDGVRIIASKTDPEATAAVLTSMGRDISDLFPEVARAVQSLLARRVVLDGEIVAFAEGRPSRALLERRVAEGFTPEIPVVFMISDVLAVGARDLRRVPLAQRKALLGELLPAPGVLRVSETLEGDPEPLISFCKEHGLDGIVSKDKGSPYVEGPEPCPEWRALVLTRRPLGHYAAPPPPTDAATRKVTVTNRQKIFWPEDGFTKGDLCDYYEAIADTLLPYLRDRPIAIVRYPDGITGKNFYQWNVPPGMPSWIHSLSLKDGKEEEKRVFLVNDAASLVWVANLACIPIHILACKKNALNDCDFFTIDFDLKSAPLVHAITLATTLHELLLAIGLPGFPKSSGQSGLHVLVPLGAGASFTTARALADLLGRILVQRHPDIATMERIISRRGDKVYVDTGQTGPTRTIVSPYSVRAQAGGTVSTPLTWDEVTPALDPKAFTMRTVVPRVARLGDPMRAMLTLSPDVPGAVEKLASLLVA